MSNEQNATSNQPSLLDRIHLFREFAKRAGWSDLAEWLTKHADEPCPAAIAEFMEMDGTPPSEPSRTDAVKEAIALVKRHDKCGRGQTGICRLEGEGRQCMTADDLRPVVAALADAEHESAHYKDELAAATKRERALEERAVDAEQKLATERTCRDHWHTVACDTAGQLEAAENRAGEIHELPSLFMLGGFRHKVTAVEGHYDGSYIAAQKIGEFDPPTKPLPPPSELVAPAEKRAKDAEARIAFHHCKPPLGNPTREEAIEQTAALTRKLATMWEGIAKAMTCGHRAGCYHAPPCTHIEILRETITAIDTPAGEGAKCNICILPLAHAGSHVNYPLGTQHDAPPTEPANAQVPANGAHPFGACCPMTAEEARRRYGPKTDRRT